MLQRHISSYCISSSANYSTFPDLRPEFFFVIKMVKKCIQKTGHWCCSATFPPISSWTNYFPTCALCFRVVKVVKFLWGKATKQRHISPCQQLGELLSQTCALCSGRVAKVVMKLFMRKASIDAAAPHFPLSTAWHNYCHSPVVLGCQAYEIYWCCSATFPPISSLANYFPRLAPRVPELWNYLFVLMTCSTVGAAIWSPAWTEIFGM